MQVRWLAKALQNLDQEADYIAKDDPQAARLVVQRIHQAVNLLADKTPPIKGTQSRGQLRMALT